MPYQGSLEDITFPNGDVYSVINLMKASVHAIEVDATSPHPTEVYVNVPTVGYITSLSLLGYDDAFYLLPFENNLSTYGLSEIVVPDYSNVSTRDLLWFALRWDSNVVSLPVYGDFATYKIQDGDSIIFRIHENSRIYIYGVFPKYKQFATVATSGSYADLTTKLTAGSNISFSGTDNLTINATDTKPTDYDTSGDKTDSVSSSATWSILSSVAITKGKWIVNFGANFPSLGSGNTGHCGVGVSDSSTAATRPPAESCLTAQRITNDNYTTLSSSFLYNCTSNTKTLYLKVRQTSGQALSVEGKLRVIKLL